MIYLSSLQGVRTSNHEVVLYNTIARIEFKTRAQVVFRLPKIDGTWR